MTTTIVTLSRMSQAQTENPPSTWRISVSTTSTAGLAKSLMATQSLYSTRLCATGEQSPGATLNEQEKLEIARQLSRLGIDVMEAGFPAASPGDLAAVRRIALTVGRTPRVR